MVRDIYIKEYVPRSWFHPKGVYKTVGRIKDRLPDVSRCLFATFTIDRQSFIEKGMGPSEAFDLTRDRVRKVFFKLRKGVKWEGKVYRITSPYCTKVEFHDDEDGWPHYHLIWLTKRFVPVDMLKALWSFGRTNLQRISNEDFDYLLKYVCKNGRVPEWLKDRDKIRIFQPSRGFLKPIPKKEKKASPNNPEKRIKRTHSIGERLDKWGKTALVVTEKPKGRKPTIMEMSLEEEFKTLYDRLVYSIALDGRYLGNGKIQITTKEEIYPWINPPK